MPAWTVVVHVDKTVRVEKKVDEKGQRLEVLQPILPGALAKSRRDSKTVRFALETEDGGEQTEGKQEEANADAEEGQRRPQDVGQEGSDEGQQFSAWAPKECACLSEWLVNAYGCPT